MIDFGVKTVEETKSLSKFLNTDTFAKKHGFIIKYFSVFSAVKAFIAVLVLLFITGLAHAQNGCCQLSQSSCMGSVTQTYCEQELKGLFQEGVACRPGTGKCGAMADDDIPNSLLWAMGGVFLCLLGFVIVIVFIAKRTRKSMNTKY